MVSGYPFFEDLQCMMDSLPVRFGGLSLYSTLEVALNAFVAFMTQF